MDENRRRLILPYQHDPAAFKPDVAKMEALLSFAWTVSATIKAEAKS